MSISTVILGGFHIICVIGLGWFMAQEDEYGNTLVAAWFPAKGDLWKRALAVTLIVLGGLATVSFFLIGAMGLLFIYALSAAGSWVASRIKAYARATGIIRKE